MMKFVILSTLLMAYYGESKFSGDPKLANVIRSDVDIIPDGQYQYVYETENGISATQQGAPKQFEKDVAIIAQGSYEYSAPDGNVKVEYVADENGYQPIGSILPTPPAIPPAIIRLLDYIKAHPRPAEA